MVNHKDENKSNNTVDNLEWCDCKYNVKYSLHKLSERKIGILIFKIAYLRGFAIRKKKGISRYIKKHFTFEERKILYDYFNGKITGDFFRSRK